MKNRNSYDSTIKIAYAGQYAIAWHSWDTNFGVLSDQIVYDGAEGSDKVAYLEQAEIEARNIENIYRGLIGKTRDIDYRNIPPQGGCFVIPCELLGRKK